MCRHIYDWNIVGCDVKQLIQFNSIQKIEIQTFSFEFQRMKLEKREKIKTALIRFRYQY